MVVDEFEIGPLVDLLDGDVKMTSIPLWNVEAEVPRRWEKLSFEIDRNFQQR